MQEPKQVLVDKYHPYRRLWVDRSGHYTSRKKAVGKATNPTAQKETNNNAD